ncbi:hypothetical protein EO238_26845 [Citrobacter sp. AAK_AS5]|nr:hypothetical protein EO238_26845 [Citrobacter sp. AAK_AS5]
MRCNDKSVPLALKDGRLHLRILVDRLSIEIFGQHGRVYMPMANLFADSERALGVQVDGGAARAVSLNVRELDSAWDTEPDTRK